MLNGDAKREVDAANEANEPGFLIVHDLEELSSLAHTIGTSNRNSTEILIPGDKSNWLVLGAQPGRVAIGAVRATDIIAWPGIVDRSLFALNVRLELKPNKVSADLRRAIDRKADHKNFLAYHNGLTVVCDKFDLESGGLLVTNPSVVNGAQSVVALHRGGQDRSLTGDLCVLVKLVEVANAPQLAKEVSRRSNTQTPVNPRNLVAHSGPQVRLKQEFSVDYPTISYETRPDHSSSPRGQVITNDSAAQLLCAIFNARPWLAIKRLTLFESENHAMIFNSGITSHHVVLADLIGQAIEKERDHFPDVYRTSWKLTRIVAAYLIGEILRAGKDEGLRLILDDPPARLRDKDKLLQELRIYAKITAATLKTYHVNLNGIDDFRSDFKNERKLKHLSDLAKQSYIFNSTMHSTEIPAPARKPRRKLKTT